MLRSLRRRIAVPFVILIIAAMLGIGIYISIFLRQVFLQNVQDGLIAEARILGETLQPGISEPQPQGYFDQLAKTWSGLIEARVTIIAPDGTVLGDSAEDYTTMDNHATRPEVIQAIQSGLGTSERFSLTTSLQTSYAAIPVYSGERLLGIVRVAISVEDVERDLAQIRRSLYSATLLTALLAVLIAIGVAADISRPILQLTETTGELAEGELHQRIVTASYREVENLAQAFNKMAAQLNSQIEALESERGKLATVLQEMTDGVVIIDESGIIQLINPAAEAMFDITSQAALNHSLAVALRHHQLVDLWEECKQTGETQSTMLEISTRRLYLQSVATPLEPGLPGSVLLLIQNLTRQRFLETVRRDFISNISHELRTPLASLKALTETLQEGALDDPPAARRFLNRIETEVDALTHMVSELLELSRIESGRVPLHLQPVIPEDIVYPAVERLHLQADRAGLNVRLDCPGDLPLILGDPVRLVQVLVNLLHNAIKFTASGGTISVQARLATRPELNAHNISPRNTPAGALLFSVQDTGVGIPEEDLPRIFERFFKSDRARSSGGTGLGLAIARHTIEAHGGRIWATSVEGHGSTFSFAIPVIEELSEVPPDEAREAGQAESPGL